MRNKRVLLAAAVCVSVIALAIVAIGALSPAPRAGLSQADAIRIARVHAEAGAGAVISAEVRRDFKTGFDVPVHPLSWVVTFSGHWELACSGNCSVNSEWVAIDYYSGDWIASQLSYPAP